ncbi:MAG: hypothetical protein IPJ65_33620 [Archangiaceae bacterium]|nr:hypothetical protein [Archangiaceae bacterium]
MRALGLALTLGCSACLDFDRAYDTRVTMLATGGAGGAAGGSAGGTAGGGATAGGSSGGDGGALTPLEVQQGDSGILYAVFGSASAPAAVGIDRDGAGVRFGFFADAPSGSWRYTDLTPLLTGTITPYAALGESPTNYWVLDSAGYATNFTGPTTYNHYERACGYDAGTHNYALTFGRNPSEVLFGGVHRHVCRYTASGVATRLNENVELDGGVIHALWLAPGDKVITLESAPGVNGSGAAVVTLLDGGELIGASRGLKVRDDLIWEATRIAGASADDFWVLDGYDRVLRYLDGGVLEMTPSYAEDRWAMLVRPPADVWLVGSTVRRFDGAEWRLIELALPGAPREYSWRSILEVSPGQLALGGLRLSPDGGVLPVYVRFAAPTP